EDLAVHLDPGLFQAVDKSAVGQIVLADSGVDALDPKAAEFPLFDAAIAVCVLQRLLQPLPRDAVIGGRPADEALGLLQDLLVAGVGGSATFDACHASFPSLRDAVGGPLLDGDAVSVGQHLAATVGALGFL